MLWGKWRRNDSSSTVPPYRCSRLLKGSWKYIFRNRWIFIDIGKWPRRIGHQVIKMTWPCHQMTSQKSSYFMRATLIFEKKNYIFEIGKMNSHTTCEKSNQMSKSSNLRHFWYYESLKKPPKCCLFSYHMHLSVSNNKIDSTVSHLLIKKTLWALFVLFLITLVDSIEPSFIYF